MANPEHFLFNSDYPTDKIVWMVEGTISITPQTIKKDWYYESYNTHSPVMLYAEGDYYFEDEPGVVYPMQELLDGDNIMAVESRTMMRNNECWVSPLFVGMWDHMSRTMHYRMWAYASESEAKNTDFGPTANIAKPRIVFTSDENYPKFVGDGFLACGSSYTHSLGYMPLVKKWHFWKNREVFDPVNYGQYIYADYYSPEGYGFFGTPWVNDSWRDKIVQVTNSQLITFSGPETASGDGNYYRMYQV